MTEQCNACRFWSEEMEHRDPSDVNWGFGWCRRNPPRIIETIVPSFFPQPSYGQQVDPDFDAVAAVNASKWPSTFATDWCGEYRLLRDEVAA